jgi:putative flippase GtrA
METMAAERESRDRAPRSGGPSFLHSFSYSQLASFVASGVDFGLLFLLVEAFGVWYVVAVAVGALAGAITNFVMNRHLSFKAAGAGWHGQAFRYAVTSGASLLLNTGGTWLVTERAGIHYGVSAIAVSLLVGWLFNYPMQRYWVFAARESVTESTGDSRA